MAGLLVLGVNAASINKRAINPEVQACITDLYIVDTLTTFVKNGINDAKTSCCVDTGVAITDEEVVAVLTMVQSITPSIQATSGSVIAKKPEFYGIPLALSVVKRDIETLLNSTDAVISCLIYKTPPEYIDEANLEKGAIHGAFDAATSAYGTGL
ncbi:hypothetical protein BDB01DRAFT_853140 [Pilobolus umbonatus]|nr:hypothetical protein BDB01DRAFT_853140 [Pilobolus umbonatus]